MSYWCCRYLVLNGAGVVLGFLFVVGVGGGFVLDGGLRGCFFLCFLFVLRIFIYEKQPIIKMGGKV